MDLGEIRRLVNDYDNLLVHFCYKNDDGAYISLTPAVVGDVPEKIVEIIDANINTYFNSRQSEYNQAGVIDGDIETCGINNHPVINDLIASFDIPQPDNINPYDIEFFVYEIQSNDTSLYFVRRHNRLRSFRKGFFGKMLNNQFNSLEQEDILGIDDKIDLIIYNEEVLILYHTAFERIFDLRNQFMEAAVNVLDNHLFYDRIQGFEQLRDDLLENLNYVKRVSKLNEVETSLLFLQRPDSTRNVIARFTLDIDMDNHGNIIYRDKTQLSEFINLMQDAYYVTLIGEGNGVDERRG